MTKAQAKVYYDYYCKLVDKLMEAKLALVGGGVKSYTIDDRSVTRFDLDKLTDELDDAIRKKEEYAAILNGGGQRRAVGFLPRDW